MVTSAPDRAHLILGARMLEDQSFQSVVSWNAAGDAFVVKVRTFQRSDWSISDLRFASQGHERVYKINSSAHV